MSFRLLLGAGTGAMAAVAALPLILGAVGFTSTGIAAGTIAAKMMSVAAVANGGGVAAGTVGAAGLSTAAKAALVTAAAVVGAMLGL
ncbi:interferon alpha-inducible protein 27-like protein 2 [Mobula hypostoma]|uniref:interferon alpha-inducible protein 27-like protein 2 n=1 Tax=Mobula hypostoma TaxID=723540 RepID=UPI002FC27ACD